jgi:hypothetical protein
MHLQGGLEIHNPEERVLWYTAEMWACYDGVEVQRDNTITLHDILLSVMVNSLINGDQALAIWRQRLEIGHALQAIPANICLTDNEVDVPWDAVGSAFDLVCRIPKIKLARASKILHKKRPDLIPIIDSVLIAYYRDVDQEGWQNLTCGEEAKKVLRLFRSDLIAARDELRPIRQRLDQLGRPLSEVRSLELLIWMERHNYALQP